MVTTLTAEHAESAEKNSLCGSLRALRRNTTRRFETLRPPDLANPADLPDPPDLPNPPDLTHPRDPPDLPDPPDPLDLLAAPIQDEGRSARRWNRSSSSAIATTWQPRSSRSAWARPCTRAARSWSSSSRSRAGTRWRCG